MKDTELMGLSCTMRESANMILFRHTRQRLQVIANNIGKNGQVYINGETFNAAQFRFLLECLTPPKD